MVTRRPCTAALLALLALSSTRAAPLRAASIEGRPEALMLATAYGVYQGIALTILLAKYDILPDRDETYFVTGPLLTLASGGATFAIANYVTNKYGLNPGQASLFNSSLTWGVLNGVGLSLTADFDVTGTMWSTLASGWSGQAIGILLARNVDRTPGQLGLMNTTSIWSAAESLLILRVLNVEKVATYSWITTAVADVGLVAGILLSNNVLISRERALLLDLGGLLGGLAGPAVLFLFFGPEDYFNDWKPWYFGAVAVGIPAGIISAWFLTRSIDSPDASAVAPPPPRQSLAGPPPLLTFPLLGGVF
jgi:hypothetical protein